MGIFRLKRKLYASMDWFNYANYGHKESPYEEIQRRKKRMEWEDKLLNEYLNNPEKISSLKNSQKKK